jgi:hypothetical protein
MASADDENTLLPRFEDRLKELAPVIAELEVRLVAELGRRNFPDSKVLWKVMAFYQALIRRTLELVSGIADARLGAGYLIALTLARSLIETLSVVWDLTTSIQKGLEQRSLSTIDKLMMDHVLATRIPSWMDDGLPNLFDRPTPAEEHDDLSSTTLPAEVCERMGGDGGSVFPAHANPGDPNGR